jgi:hypothetical protein
MIYEIQSFFANFIFFVFEIKNGVDFHDVECKSSE